MGYSLGSKTLAISLMALTGGDKAKADRLWADLGHLYADGWDDVWQFVEDWLAKDAAGG